MEGIVEGSLVQTPQAGVQVNPQAFRGPVLQKGRAYAKAAEDVSGLFQDTTNMILQNRMAKQVFQADLNMRKSYDDFTASLVRMPDSGQWLPAWNEASDGVREQTLDDPHLSPDAKRIIGQKFDNWKEATTSAVNIAALKKGLNETRDIYHQDSTYAANTGHVDGPGGANDLADAAFANHAISSEERDRDKKRFIVMDAKAKTDQAIIRFPIESRKILEGATWFQHLTEADKKTALTAADAAKTRQWKRNFDDLLVQKLDAATGAIPEETIRDAITKKQIDPKAGENLIAAQKRDSEKGDEDQKKYVGALAHDPVAWQAGKPDEYAARLTQEASKIKNPTVRQQTIDDIDKELASVRKTAATTDAPVHREQLEQMTKVSNERVGLVPTTSKRPTEPPFLEGGLKKVETMSDADFKAAFGHTANRAAVIRMVQDREEAERNRLSEAMQKYRDWSHTEKGQQATPKEAAEMRESLGFGQYQTALDVKAALQGGKISRAMAKEILANQFGIQ